MKKTTLAKILGISCAVCIVGGAISMEFGTQTLAEETSVLVESTL